VEVQVVEELLPEEPGAVVLEALVQEQLLAQPILAVVVAVGMV